MPNAARLIITPLSGSCGFSIFNRWMICPAAKRRQRSLNSLFRKEMRFSPKEAQTAVVSFAKIDAYNIQCRGTGLDAGAGRNVGFSLQAVGCDRALLIEQLLERPGKRPDRTVIVEFLS